jgi:hypothetical protein
MTLDLSLTPTDELLAALKARYDHVIFLGEQHQGPTDEWKADWQGHSTYCVGMCMDLVWAIQAWAHSDKVEDEEHGGQA